MTLEKSEYRKPRPHALHRWFPLRLDLFELRVTSIVDTNTGRSSTEFFVASYHGLIIAEISVPLQLQVHLCCYYVTERPWSWRNIFYLGGCPRFSTPGLKLATILDVCHGAQWRAQ